MEPRDRRAQTLKSPAPAPDRLIWRFRLAVVSVALVALAFVQSPGRILTDTKVDLAVDPVGFLTRALTLWDPDGAFGQVQNQAYGYLFPMGPFFAAGDLLRLEPWVVQRLWWGLLLVTAFLGIVKLCAALHLGAPWARVVAGLAYALSPRMLSVIGPSSIEVWPMALAPWVLVPLVVGLRRQNPRWMAALSALAVACVGGVNAVATFAVIPLGAVWLLLAPAGPRRRSMMLWWPVFVLLGTLWWLIPLFMLGSYSPPFLDYIESASTTTFAATLFDALRGTTNWVPYVDTFSVAGNDLLRSIGLIVNGAVIVALGLVGIARSRAAHRRFLLVGLLVGLALLTLGHTGAVQGWGAGSVQQALDGLLSPLRNTHKFDLVVRIPLVLGFAYALSGLGARIKDANTDRTLRTGIAVLGVAAVFGATVPAWTGNLANRGTYESVPDYWQEASSWLSEQHVDQRALLVPATSFGNYLWGRTGDEVLQPLADSPWAVRNAIPLAPGGNIRTLDTIERRLATGKGSEGLARYLKRSGVGYLVVRNDLAFDTEHTDNERVYAALASTPGVRPVAQFGPMLGSPAVITDEDGEDVLINGGWQAVRPAVEIFAVGAPASGPVTVQDLDDTPVVAGGPESLLTLDETGQSPSVVLADEAGDVFGDGVRPETVVLTDGSRRQEAAFGRAEQNRSNTMVDARDYTLDRPVHDYRVSDHEEYVSVPRLVGVNRISASSSQADAASPGPLVPAQQAWSAFDGDPRTFWKAGASDPETSWVELDLGSARAIEQLQLTMSRTAERNRSLTVSTDAGSVDVDAQPGVPLTVTLPQGRTSTVRISGRASALDPLTLADVTIPGVALSRPLVMPDLPYTWNAPERIVMAVDQAYRSGCLEVEAVTRCVPGEEQWGEEGRVLDRELSLNASATYVPTLKVASIGGAALDAIAQTGRLAGAQVSSYSVESPHNSAVRAIDADPRTGWVASAEDDDPTLTLAWLGDQSVGRLKVETHDSLAASAPLEATLRFPDGTEREVTFDDGVATFAPVVAKSVEIHFGTTDDRPQTDPLGVRTTLPVGVSEVTIPGRRGLFPQPPLTEKRIGRCGNGPTVEIDGRTYRTRVAATPVDILAGEDLSAELCTGDAVALSTGKHRIRVVGNDAYRPASLVLDDTQTVATAAELATEVETPRWERTERMLDLGATAGAGAEGDSERLVTVAENLNKGWQDANGRPAVQINGWQQGWVVDSDTDEVQLSFAPATPYRVALGTGAALAVILLGCVLLVRRRLGPATTSQGRRSGDVVVLALLVASSGLVASTSGLVVALAALLVGLGIRRFSAEALAWLTPLPVLVAAGAYVVRPWGSDAGWAGSLAWPQLLVVVSLGLLTASVLGFGLRRPRLRRRIAGSSTTR